MISIIMGFFAILRAGALPMGQRRTGIIFFYSFCTLGFVLFLLQTLPLNPQFSDMLKKITFFCFILIPVIFSITIVKKRESQEYIDWFAAVSIIMLLIFSILYVDQNILPIFAIYIPILAVCIFHAYKAFNDSITPGQQSDNFRILCLQGLLVITPPAAFFLGYNWQEAPLLIFINPLWVIWETWKINSEKQNEDYNVEIAADYIAPALLLTLLFLAFRGATMLSDDLRDIDFTYRIKAALAISISLAGTLLSDPLKTGLKKFIRLLSQRYTDALSSNLIRLQEQRKTFEPEEIQDHLLKYFPGIDTSILFRLPFKKIFKVSHILTGSFSDIADSSLINVTMMMEFGKEGYSIISPGNMENLDLKSPFMEKALSIADKSDILLIPLYDSPENLPDIIFTFIHNEKSSFSPGLIRNLYRWAKVMKLSILSLRKKSCPDKIELSDELMQVTTPCEMAIAAGNLLSLQLPLKSFHLLLSNETAEGLSIIPSTSEIPDNVLKTVTAIADGISINESRNEKQSPLEIHQKDAMIILESCLILKIPSFENVRRFACIEFESEIFHYSPSDKKTYDDFALQLGLLLDKLNISEELEEHRGLVDILEKKVDNQRLRVAEDLHDTVAQEMFAAKMMVEMLEKQLKGTSPHTGEDIRILRSAVDEGLRKIRSMIGKLREDEGGRKENFIDELKDFSAKIESETGMKIVFENTDLTESLSDEMLFEISMIIREAINNARKHADAKHMEVKFSSKGDDLLLKIRDDGKGFLHENCESKDSFGITGMKSRCKRLGGQLNIVSSPGKGTEIIITLNRTILG